MRSLQGSDARPLTCAQPVMPGLTARRPRWRSVYWSTWTGTVGRGPMIDISPRTTFTRLGSSSSEVRRRSAPDARDPRVALVDRQAGADELRAGDHRAQLVDVERLAVAADPALAVERVAGRLEPDRQAGERDERRGRRRAAASADDEVEERGGSSRVPSAGSQPAAVPWRR